MPSFLNVFRKVFGSSDDNTSAAQIVKAVAAATQKNDELVNSAIRDIRSGKYTTQEQKAAIEKLQTRIDNAVAAGRVPAPRDQQAFLNLREARAYGSYRSYKEQAKDPNAPAIVKDIASRPYQKDMSNPWKDFKGYDADTILKIYGFDRIIKVLNKDQKTSLWNSIMRDHDAARIAIEKRYGTTITPFKSPENARKPSEMQARDAMNNITNSKEWGPRAPKATVSRFKQYPDEPLNPRIKDVRAFVDKDEIALRMTVDGKEKWLNIRNKNTVDAYNAGAIPDNVLANKSLAVAESMQANLQSRFEMVLDEQRGQGQADNQGLHR